jgi:hypothetical protein
MGNHHIVLKAQDGGLVIFFELIESGFSPWAFFPAL